MEPILLIRNSKSGLALGEQKIQKEIEEGIVSLTEYGFEVTTVSVEDILEKEMFDKKVESLSPGTIIAVGGDGTVNLVANYLTGSSIRMAVIPAGTFNHFAKHIGIGTNIPQAFDTVMTGETINIDTAEVNGRTFVNFSCIGFYTQIIKRRTAYQKKSWKKWPAFGMSMYECMKEYSSYSFVIKKNDSEMKVRTPLIFVGNNIFDFGGLDVLSSRQDFTSGKLQLSIAKEMGRWRIFLLAFRSLFMDVKNQLGFTTTAIDEIEIHANKSKVWVSLDGEVIKLQTPLRYKIIPQSLCMIIPRTTVPSQHPL
ncbi:MAG: diacylglycerol kinase family protein [Patescibacteria group bacterium]